MKVAIIGANGFIGRHLTEHLAVDKELSLHLFGRSPLSHFDSRFPYSQIDFFNQAELVKNFSGVDVVYYLASETIPSSSWENPLIEIEKNLKPFLSFLNVVSPLHIKKIVFVSSAGTVYGPSSGKVDELANKQPFSPYGIVKLTMENFLNYYKAKFGLEFDIYRVSNVYGEGQDTSKGLGIINTFLEKIIRDKKVQVFGDGNNTRNYIYVKDVATLMGYSLNHLNSSEIFNVSSNTTCSINELVTTMRKVVQEQFDVDYTPSRLSDNSFIDLDNSKIQKYNKSFEFTPISEGIQKTYHALKNQTKTTK